MSAFREVLVFLSNIGVYDVILPFLLVFTIVYAMLEKTKVLGMESVGDVQVTRKNLNAMVAFVAGFFVIASTQLVAIIHEFTANVVLILLLIVLFLMLAGAFHEESDKSFFLTKGWKTTFMIITFFSIMLIFLNALGWLQLGWAYMVTQWDSTLVGVILLFAVMIGLIFFVVKDPNAATAKKKD